MRGWNIRTKRSGRISPPLGLSIESILLQDPVILENVSQTYYTVRTCCDFYYTPAKIRRWYFFSLLIILLNKYELRTNPMNCVHSDGCTGDSTSSCNNITIPLFVERYMKHAITMGTIHRETWVPIDLFLIFVFHRNTIVFILKYAEFSQYYWSELAFIR